MNELCFCIIKRTDPFLLRNMDVHYSRPRGFVGRNICYSVSFQGHCYGHIVFGSATRFLPGRDKFLGINSIESLNTIANNLLYHVEPKEWGYPFRNFTSSVIEQITPIIQTDWLNKYGDSLIALETLVQLPRTGECYKRAGWKPVGVTKGFSCKRTGGNGTDSWTGKRVWNTSILTPKIVLMKILENKLNKSGG